MCVCLFDWTQTIALIICDSRSKSIFIRFILLPQIERLLYINFFNSLISLLLNGRINKSTLQFHCHIKNDHFIVALLMQSHFLMRILLLDFMNQKKIPFCFFYERILFDDPWEYFFIDRDILLLEAHLKISKNRCWKHKIEFVIDRSSMTNDHKLNWEQFLCQMK